MLVALDVSAVCSRSLVEKRSVVSMTALALEVTVVVVPVVFVVVAGS